MIYIYAKKLQLWDVLDITQPCILSCVGAGGKTSLIQSLAKSAKQQGRPVLVTTTTKMFYNQVAGYNLVLSDDYGEGSKQVTNLLFNTQPVETAGWFAKINDKKVIGLVPEWIDQLALSIPDAYILVEADGAQTRLLKAPAAHEPVVPNCTYITVGVLNLTVIGQPLSPEYVHRPELVAKILQKQVGEKVSCQDLAQLASDPLGIFKGAKGIKAVLLTGYHENKMGLVQEIVRLLSATDISRLVVTAGFGEDMVPVAVY